MNTIITNRYLTRAFRALTKMIALGVVLVIGLPTFGQGIEIIGNDGKQVEISPEVEGVPNAPRAEAHIDDPGRARGTGLTVLGPDGQPMFLPTGDARSVQIQRSFSTKMIDGQRQVAQTGTAIVVDADGQRREYELAETDDIDGLATIQPHQQPEAKKSWMIGVVCQPAPEMVRSHLGLEEETGLLVQQVQPGSPADIAGLKKFDVLLYADDQQLTSLQDLTTVVSEVGQEESVIGLTVVRGGDEIPVEVTPVERDYAAMPMRQLPMNMFEMNDMGPGIIFRNGLDDGAGMNRMREMMQQQMNQMKAEFQNLDALIQEGLPMNIPAPRMEPR